MKISRVALLAIVFASVAPLAVSAQEERPSRVAVDTSAAVENSVDANGRQLTGMWVDAVVSVGIGKGFEAVAWPIAQRVANTGVRSADLWIATLRYQRPGPIGIRIDGGLLGSPVGLANLTVRRPHLNPTIAQPAALFIALPALEDGGPRPNLLGAIYPFGAQVSVSGARWDARAAVIDTSPLRRRGIFVDPKPPRFTNLVMGGGVTPFVGFRVGASMTHGGWMRAGESPSIPTTRSATVVTVESELSFAYSKLAGEWVHDAIETSAGRRVATGWFIQGQQTLAPRWFVAGRVERLNSPLVLFARPQVQQMTTIEETLGYRVTQDVTVRASHRARQGFGRPDYGHQFSMSLVWWKRWI
jgi:hypothetical protein